MIVEILALYFLIQCTNMFARLIERRHDVLNYVPRSNPV
jgi:hypothetical protein